ncbi:hypothetical protein [Sulfurimonas autotrophica]|uniref:NnrS family protein n=1 Tax=Sulfurimonas autotrophica (strain ATCC BAA-671 / DSM 16294 / JCM 11897 / OK10) TaxID=563040 RepID=E0UQB9_SULAO|nr:hypothetical protein [Sulfurimonas autotrophica]ADN09862.1 conserved hypothetical protein [Sulfurimonas autotrophica DSM 16294]
MFQGLSLEQAPPYTIPIKFYLTAALYLIALSIIILIYGLHVSSRYEYEVIALTHIFTIGFITHIMFGSLFQMLPVMLGTAYANIVRNAKTIHIFLNIGIVSFIAGFLTNSPPFLYIGGTLLALTFLYFCFISLKTIFLSKEINAPVQNFAASFAALFIAVIFGFTALLGHFGFVDSIKYGNVHIAVMLFGWVFILIISVSYKIIPMFFVAKEFPLFLQKRLYIIQLILLFLFIFAQLQENILLLNVIKILLSCSVILFALFSIKILRQRKRARKDISINLWYFAMTNTVLSSILFITATLLHVNIYLYIGFLVLFGAIYPLINAMLYKIIPFLTWFHLSSNMVFDAEMGNVISKKKMLYQVNLYYLSFCLFLFTPFWHFFLIAAAIVFMFWALLLFVNILNALKYYNEYIKKKVVFE